MAIRNNGALRILTKDKMSIISVDPKILPQAVIMYMLIQEIVLFAIPNQLFVSSLENMKMKFMQKKLSN